MTRHQFIIATPAWHASLPGAVAGILTMTGVATPDRGPALDEKRSALVESLRTRYRGFSRADLRATPPLPAYDAYYSRFKQTYHVLLQCESVAIKGKPLPRRPPLVDAMFLAELDSLLLTAGHDLDRLTRPVVIDVAGPDESYVGIGGKAETCRPGDMVMRDGEGVICSIIQGPDNRTALTPETREAMFVVYAPPGVGAEPVRKHLANIATNIQQIASAAKIDILTTIEAGAPRS